MSGTPPVEMAAMPPLHDAGNGIPAGVEPVLEAVDVTKHFAAHGGNPLRRQHRIVHAVDGVSLKLYPGYITALVGESGCGKSTLARLFAQLYPVTSGEIRYRGQAVKTTGGKAFRAYVSKVQLILQDPFGSLNPVSLISRTLQRAVRIHHGGTSRAQQRAVIDDLLRQVNLVPAQQFTEKFPHELSGGQLQRISIARALAANPDVFLADEPVSNLDVSIRLGILNLLRKLTLERNVALLYVTHDIASARYFAAETAVMYAGELIEQGPSEQVTQHAAHPYTQLLIASAPDPSRIGSTRALDIGQPPSLIDPPAGCRFHPRCPYAMQRCRTATPPRFELGGSHTARCWLYAEDEEATARRTENSAAPAAAPAPATAADAVRRTGRTTPSTTTQPLGPQTKEQSQ